MPIYSETFAHCCWFFSTKIRLESGSIWPSVSMKGIRFFFRNILWIIFFEESNGKLFKFLSCPLINKCSSFFYKNQGRIWVNLTQCVNEENSIFSSKRIFNIFFWSNQIRKLFKFLSCPLINKYLDTVADFFFIKHRGRIWVNLTQCVNEGLTRRK